MEGFVLGVKTATAVTGVCQKNELDGEEKCRSLKSVSEPCLVDLTL
jgi:hypothetical protein